jgi:hypothetical protein
MRISLFSSIALLGAGLAGCPEGSECEVDSDCDTNLRCIDHVCTTDPGAADVGPKDSGTPDSGGPSCGNGMIETGEMCDPPAPSCDTTFCGTTCQMETRTPACGDGCADPGEHCGEPNVTCAATQTCSSCTCTPPICGDGFADNGETCGEPGLAPCEQGQVCVPATCTCASPTCGDGVASAGEDCGEPGLLDCAQGSECVSCVCSPLCGNGRVDPGEECAELMLTCAPTAECNVATCACIPLCGNMRLDPGEACDPPTPITGVTCTATTSCSGTCQIVPRPVLCGDGCLDPPEDCNEPGGAACTMGACDPGTCTCPQCGDGVLTAGEQCDPPGGQCNTDETCNLGTCTCEPIVTLGRPFALVAGQSDVDMITTFEQSVALMSLPDSAFTQVPAISTGVIFVADYVMLGVNPLGNLDTDTTTTIPSAPQLLGWDDLGAPSSVGLPEMTGGYPNDASGFAFRESRTTTTGAPRPFEEDAISPGCLCEGWGVRFEAGTSTLTAIAFEGGANAAGSSLFPDPTPLFFGTTYDPIQEAWFVRSRVEIGPMQVTMDYSIRKRDKYVAERIELTNTSTLPIFDIRYVRTLDFDIGPGHYSGDEFKFLYPVGVPQLIRSHDTLGDLEGTETSTSDNYFGVATVSPAMTCANGITFADNDPDYILIGDEGPPEGEPDGLPDCNVDPNNERGDFSGSFVFQVPILAGGTTTEL